MSSKEASSALIGWNPVNGIIVAIRLKSRHTKGTIVTVYAPTEEALGYEQSQYVFQANAFLTLFHNMTLSYS